MLTSLHCLLKHELIEYLSKSLAFNYFTRVQRYLCLWAHLLATFADCYRPICLRRLTAFTVRSILTCLLTWVRKLYCRSPNNRTDAQPHTLSAVLYTVYDISQANGQISIGDWRLQVRLKICAFIYSGKMHGIYTEANRPFNARPFE